MARSDRSRRRCPCQSGRQYRRCCAPLHQGNPPPSALSLMRARYCAYALGIVDFILDTTHPDSPHHQQGRDAWRQTVERFATQTRFKRLVIHEDVPGETEAYVHFTATLEQDGQPLDMTERSRFLKVDDRWMYFSAI